MSITIPGSEYTGPKSIAEEISTRERIAAKESREHTVIIITNGHTEYESWKWLWERSQPLPDNWKWPIENKRDSEIA